MCSIEEMEKKFIELDKLEPKEDKRRRQKKETKATKFERQFRTKLDEDKGGVLMNKFLCRCERSDKFTIVDLKRLKYLNYLLKEHGFMVSEDGCSAVRIKK